MMVFLLTDEELRITKIYANGIGNTDLAEKRKEEMLFLRFEKKWPLRKIGKRYGISRQRVVQIIGKTGKQNGGFHYSSSVPLRYLENKQEYFIDKTINDVAEEFGIATKVATKVMSSYRHEISADKDSPRAVGHEWEKWASQWLKDKQIRNKLMPINHPFDILALGCVRIDVKVSVSPHIPPSLDGKLVNPRWHFGAGKANKRDDCDFYLVVLGEIEEVFVIPSSKVPRHLTNIHFCWPTARPELSKWQDYHDAYDLIIAHSINI